MLNISGQGSELGLVGSWDGRGFRFICVRTPRYIYLSFGAQWGYYRDGETSMYLLGHRYYDLNHGRFLNQDPIGFGGGINVYSYASDDPASKKDPAGLWWMGVSVGGAAGCGFGFGPFGFGMFGSAGLGIDGYGNVGLYSMSGFGSSLGTKGLFAFGGVGGDVGNGNFTDPPSYGYGGMGGVAGVDGIGGNAFFGGPGLFNTSGPAGDDAPATYSGGISVKDLGGVGAGVVSGPAASGSVVLFNVGSFFRWIGDGIRHITNGWR